jgi:hypothetical protein
MIQQLKINIRAANDVRVMAWVNHVPVSFDSVINLDLEIDNVVELRQETPKDNAFFYIDSVCLGNLDITELLHHYGICQVLDINRNKIANFVSDIGSTDHVIITVNRNFYSKIVQHMDIVFVL